MADKSAPSDKSFWTRLPGILTGIAAVITAIATLFGAPNAAGVITFQATPTVSPGVPAFTFTFAPNPAKRGTDVEIHTRTAMDTAIVYLNGQPLSKNVQANGRTLIITIPAIATSDYIEIEWQGTRQRFTKILNVSPY